MARGAANSRMVIFLCLAYICAVQASFVLSTHSSAAHCFTLLDLLLTVNRGMDEFNPAMGNNFLVDGIWVTPHLIIGYLACFYPTRDLKGYSIQVVSRTGSRMAWFFSKAAWVTAVVVLFCIAEAALATALTSLFGDISNPGISPWSLLLTGIDFSQAGTFSLIGALALVPATLLAMSYAAMALSLVIRPIWAYLALLLGLVASAYFDSNALSIDFSMVARNNVALPGGFSTAFALFVCLAAAALSILLGLLVSRKVEYR